MHPDHAKWLDDINRRVMEVFYGGKFPGYIIEKVKPPVETPKEQPTDGAIHRHVYG